MRPITLSRAWLKSPWSFVIAVFAWTWTFWLIAILNGIGTQTNPKVCCWPSCGLLGPMLGGIACSAR